MNSSADKVMSEIVIDAAVIGEKNETAIVRHAFRNDIIIFTFFQSFTFLTALIALTGAFIATETQYKISNNIKTILLKYSLLLQHPCVTVLRKNS